MMDQLEFLELCTIGNVDQVRSALSLNLVDKKFSHKVNGWTALHWAAKRGHSKIVRLLLNAGFDPSARTNDGKRPIDLTTLPEVASLFLSYGIAQEDDEDTSESDAQAQVDENESEKFVPNYLKNPPFPYSNGKLPTVVDSSNTAISKQNGSIGNGTVTNGTIANGTVTNGFVPNSGKAKFILVRTSVQGGKEAYKRFTLPGNGSFEFFKASIEKEMDQGKIAAILTVPDGILIENTAQLAELDNSQKVELVYFDHKSNSKIAGTNNGKCSVKSVINEEISSFSGYILPIVVVLAGFAALGGFILARKWK